MDQKIEEKLEDGTTTIVDIESILKKTKPIEYYKEKYKHLDIPGLQYELALDAVYEKIRHAKDNKKDLTEQELIDLIDNAFANLALKYSLERKKYFLTNLLPICLSSLAVFLSIISIILGKIV